MKKPAILLAFAGAFIFTAMALGRAQGVPPYLSFQGKLLTPANVPQNETVQMIFSIYTVSTGGTAIWTETQPSVVVTNGVFSAQLGSVTALSTAVFSGSNAYLGVKVGTDAEMTPRQQLVTSPYAFSAAHLMSNGPVSIDAGVYYSTFDASGNLIISNGVSASSASLTYGLTAATAAFSGAISDNSENVTNGVAAASATFSSTAGNYDLTVSSGIKMQSGTLSISTADTAAAPSFFISGSSVTLGNGGSPFGKLLLGNCSLTSITCAKQTVTNFGACTATGVTADSPVFYSLDGSIGTGVAVALVSVAANSLTFGCVNPTTASGGVTTTTRTLNWAAVVIP